MEYHHCLYKLIVSHDAEGIITGGQIRAARALLRWTAEMLAERLQVGVATIKRAEDLDGMVCMTGPNVEAVRRAFHDAGVKFIPENGGAGVRMREPG